MQNLILSLVVYEKLNHLIFIHKIVTWHRVHASLLWYFSHTFSFFFINCFIASLFLLMPLPHSLPMYLYQTTTISLYLSLSVAQSPFYSPYRYYFVIVSPYLPLSLSLSSLWCNLWLCDVIPLLPPFLLWYEYHYYCFVFVLIIIISLPVSSLAYMKMNIFEKSLFSIFLYFFYFSLFLHFLFLYLLYILIFDKFLFFVFLSSSVFICS